MKKLFKLFEGVVFSVFGLLFPDNKEETDTKADQSENTNKSGVWFVFIILVLMTTFILITRA
jgi:hypothetical protein